MLAIPALLQSRLDSGATTLARAWIVRRRDGVVQGFTDHDRDLVVDGVTCRAGTGFAAAEATSRFDLATDGAEVSGALADDALSEADLAAGRYDAARIETWIADWSEPALSVRLAGAILGEVRREAKRSRRSCAASATCCRRRAGDSTPRGAKPISATRVAAPI